MIEREAVLKAIYEIMADSHSSIFLRYGVTSPAERERAADELATYLVLPVIKKLIEVDGLLVEING